jgi:hypothetical protein
MSWPAAGGVCAEAPRRGSVSGGSPEELLTLLNDRLLTAEECQTPLVEAGLDILNALKHFHHPDSLSKTLERAPL